MMQLLFLLFFTGVQISSEPFDLENYPDEKYMHFAEKKKELYVFYRDSLDIISIPELVVKSKSQIENLDKIEYNKYSFVSNKEGVFLVENLGGLVYKLVGNTLVRIDQSFTHKMQIYSTVFSYQDMIYKYGGYGFWSQRNFFTYFDPGTQEWEAMFPENGSKVPKGSQSSSIAIDEKDIYVYGGMHLSPYKYDQFNQNKEVWKFNTEDKEWTFLGKYWIDLQGTEAFKKRNVPFNYGSKQVYSVDNILYVVDVVNNTLKAYHLTSVQTKMRPPHQSFFSNGIFYTFIKRFGVESHFELITRNEDEFFGELIYEKRFYRHYRYLYMGGFSIALGAFLWIIYFRVKSWRIKRNKVIVSDKMLFYKGNILVLDAKVVNIINLLIRSKEDVLSREIMAITENKALNYAHNTKVKNALIDQINFKFKSLIGTKENVISFRKSDLDKRIKVYSINRDWFYLKK
jgi:hypothetical protein